MTPPSDPADKQHYNTFVIELLQDERRNVRRTRVTHVQTGMEKTWPGWNESGLLRFLVTHATIPSSPS